MGMQSARKVCVNWNEETGCTEQYPEECLVREECKKEAERRATKTKGSK